MAVNSESIIGKCAKLVRAGRTYILRNVKINWGIGNTNLNVVRQGPAQVDSIYPGNRLLVFNLIEGGDIQVPKEVVISAQRDGEGEVLRFTVPVQQVHDMSAGLSRHGTRLIHVLAARRIIMDLEDNSKADVSPAVKSSITRLGIEYQLASRFTSFIAVDKRNKKPLAEQSETPVASSDNLFSPRGMAYKMSAPLVSRATASRPQLFGWGSHSASNALQGPQPSTVSFGGSTAGLFNATGSAPAAPPPPIGGSLFGSNSRAGQSSPSSAVFGSTSPLFPRGGNSSGFGLFGGARTERSRDLIVSPPSPPSPGIYSHPAFAAPPPPASSAPGAPAPPARSSSPPRPLFGTPTPAAPSSPDDRVANLVRLQSFDGSFAPSAHLELIVGKERLAQAAAQGVDGKAWATALAVAYLKLYMKGQPELLDGLVEKAVAFLEGAVDDVDDVLARAERWVAQQQ